jgi:hypothetical protein
MRFEVPQFIEIEDKIIGPFTWKQFIYIAGGLGLGFVLFVTAPIVIFVLFGLPIAILGGLLAYYPVNNRPFSIFLESVVTYYKRHRLYYWRKRADIVYRGRVEETATGYSEQYPTVKTGSGSGINSLSRKLELQAIQKK